MSSNTICFNELSLTPFCQDEQEVEQRLRLYVETLKTAGRSGIKKVRYHENMVNIPLSSTMSMQQYCSKYPNRDIVTLLLSTFTMPQVDENDDTILEKYCSTKVCITLKDKPVRAHGFNAAYCYNTYCIAFRSDVFWYQCLYKISVFSGEAERDIEWPCLSHPSHFDEAEFIGWRTSVNPIYLLTTKALSSNKPIHLRDDHGKDVLLEHACRLRACEYVDAIINSLPFHPHTKQYVHKVYDNGVIHLVLHWTDKGFGLAVQTTGRDIRETQEIAKILKNRFDNQ